MFKEWILQQRTASIVQLAYLGALEGSHGVPRQSTQWCGEERPCQCEALTCDSPTRYQEVLHLLTRLSSRPPMSCPPSRCVGTAPTSLQQASGGVMLAEWLLRSTSTRQPAAPCQQANANKIATLQTADSQNNHILVAIPCGGREKGPMTMAGGNGKNTKDSGEISHLKYGCIETAQQRVIMDEEREFLPTDVGGSNNFPIMNHSSCSCNPSKLRCICGKMSDHQINQYLQDSEANLTGHFGSQAPGQIVKKSKEPRKVAECWTLTPILNSPCNVSPFDEKFYSGHFPTEPEVSGTLPKLKNESTKESSKNDPENEFHSRSKRCRLSNTPDENVFGTDKILQNMKADVDARASGYFNIINKHMPESWFHTTLQNSLERLSFRSKFIDDRGSLSLWILDLLTILHLCKLTNFENVSLDFPSFTFDILIGILSQINNFELSQSIHSISLPFDETETARGLGFCNYASQSEKNIAFSKSPSRFLLVVRSFTNLRCLRVRSCEEKLLRCLQHLQLSSLFLTSSHLKNRTILKNFLGLQCTGDDWHRSFPTAMTAFDMFGKPLSTSLKTLHIPNCKVSMITYRSLIQIFPDLTDLQVKPKLELLTQRQLNADTTSNLNESSKVHQNSMTHFRSLSLTCVELALFDIRSTFPFLQHLTVQLDNEDTLQILPIVNELRHLETLQLKYLPTFNHVYRNIALDNVYPFLKKKLESLTTLTLQNFDISTASFNMLSTLPKLSSLTLESCWIGASDCQPLPKLSSLPLKSSWVKVLDCQPKHVPMFTQLTELHLTSIPSRSVTNCLFSSDSIEHLTIVPQNNEMQVSVTSSTERSFRDLLSAGIMVSLLSLTISSYFLSPSLVKQLSLLPRLQKVTTIEQPGSSARDLLKCVSTTPSHITFSSES